MILAALSEESTRNLAATGLGMIVGFGLMIFFIIALVKACGKKTQGWIVTCIVTFLLTAGAFTAAGIYGYPELKNFIAMANKIEKKMISKSGRFQMTVPNSWQSMPDLNEDADLGAANLLAEHYLVLIPESKKSLNMDLPAFAKLVTGEMQKSMQNATLSDFEVLTVAGFPALRCRLAGTVDGLAISYHHTSIETPDDLCQILCWTLTPREKTSFPIFAQVAETIVLTTK